MNNTEAVNNTQTGGKLSPGFSGLSVLAFSIGTSIGWGSLVVTCNTYLSQAGIFGTVFGLLIGMLIIFVITHNLQYLICRNQDAGGIYSYSSKVCGGDFGFLTAWFLLLSYMAVLWANITSLPLFARYFFGDIFRFGFHYEIFGYEVWLGETLISICAILVVGLFCMYGRRIIHIVMIISAAAFVFGFAYCAVWALIGHETSSFSFDPAFVPDSKALSQIVRIAVISPWAFIGFENVAHFSEEYTFKVKKIRRILVISVIVSTALYIMVTLLSVTAYPPEYSSWLEYIRDMGNLSGIKAVPAFYAIDHYLGRTGVTILFAALLGAILTSLIGNTLALSRLLYAFGRDGNAPSGLAKVSRKGNPFIAVAAVVIISVFIPFIGRTAIGWIVDITTLAATIVYALLSFAVFKDAKENAHRLQQTTGIAGLILMLIFVLLILLPNILGTGGMSTESYFLFDLWAVVGLIYFRAILKKNKAHNHERSELVWMVLLLFVLFAFMMWVTQETETITDDTLEEVSEYVHNGEADEAEIEDYIHTQEDHINKNNTWYTVAFFVMFILSAGIILNNYHMIQKNNKERTKQLAATKEHELEDKLTGLLNKHAYSLTEQKFDDRIDEGTVGSFAVVVCDINDLKLLNEQGGRNAGDTCIRRTGHVISEIFNYSPVFRVGGDEFVVVLEKSDYDNREALVGELKKCTDDRKKIIGATLAVGMSEYSKEDGDSFINVFSRADEKMYEHKMETKTSDQQ